MESYMCYLLYVWLESAVCLADFMVYTVVQYIQYFSTRRFSCCYRYSQLFLFISILCSFLLSAFICFLLKIKHPKTQVKIGLKDASNCNCMSANPAKWDVGQHFKLPQHLRTTSTESHMHQVEQLATLHQHHWRGVLEIANRSHEELLEFPIKVWWLKYMILVFL